MGVFRSGEVVLESVEMLFFHAVRSFREFWRVLESFPEWSSSFGEWLTSFWEFLRVFRSFGDVWRVGGRGGGGWGDTFLCREERLESFGEFWGVLESFWEWRKSGGRVFGTVAKLIL